MTQKDKNSKESVVVYENTTLDINVSVNPFGYNKAVEIAYKKAERLVLATHLVTNIVPENELVKDNVRAQAQNLLADVLTLRAGMRGADSHGVREVVTRIRHILSLLDILHATGHISNMNLEVLKGAYLDFVRFMWASEDGASAEQYALGEDFFATKATPAHGHSQGQKSITDTSVKDNIKDSVKDTVTDTKDIKDKKSTENIKKSRKSVRSKRQTRSRRMAILDVVTKSGPVHITDIARDVPQWSMKTIQRELASLMRDGTVKKEGAKRWTMYSLVV